MHENAPGRPLLSLIQKTAVDHGYEYTFWEVSGIDPKEPDPKKRRIRRKFKDEGRARAWKNEKEVELLNTVRRHRSVTTTLTLEQLDAAEAAVKRLGDRYTLPQVVDYFFQHYREADFVIRFGDASVAFRGDLEGQVRDRSLIQLKSTLSQFERFTENPFVHEVSTPDIVGFLKSLRARGGVNQAKAKTWNNYRADLHLFFEWCADRQRRWVANNPVSDVPRKQVENGHVEILSLKTAQALMDYVAEFKNGKYARYYALALFGGVRPGGELEKLATHSALINLADRVVRITPMVSKTKKPRQIKIRENFYQWLTQFGGEILPINSDRELKAIRKKFSLSRDVLRHTFTSMHIGAFKSFADAALESGNTEKIIKDHYLNTSSFDDAQAFWQIAPAQAERKVVHLA
jgi:site-specific recombinase XerD